MQRRVRIGDIPLLPLPCQAQPPGEHRKSYFALVMLHPVRGRVKLKRGFVDLDPIPDSDRRIRHPGQRNVRQTRFILCVAAADIGVIAGEPELLEGAKSVGVPVRSRPVRVAPPDACERAARFSSIEIA